MRAISAPLGAALLALAIGSTPAFAQGFGGGGSDSGGGGDTRHRVEGATHIKPQPKLTAEQKKKLEAFQKAKADAEKNKQSQTVATQATASMTIDPASTYEDALTCYQYYGVSMQIANALKARPGLAENQVSQYDAVSRMSNYQQQVWFKRLGDVNGDKKVEEMNADLQRVAGGVITDANAGLGGDTAAQERNAAVKAKCHTFEKVGPTPG